MRTALASISLALLATIVAAVVHACGIYGAPEAALQPGVVAGDQFVCVTTAGHLVVRDLKKNAHRDFTELKLRFLSAIDVRDNRACVATAENVHVIDLATGQMLHTLPHSKGPVNVGFAGKDQVFAASPEAVEIFDLTAGKLRHRVELRKPRPQPAGKADAKGPSNTATKPASRRSTYGFARAWLTEGIAPCCLHEHLLFVALPKDGQDSALDLTALRSVAVIDLRQGRRSEEVQVERGITGLSTAGGRLIVRSGILSYGIPLESCTSYPITEGKVDAKSPEVRRYRASYDMDFYRGAIAFIEGGDQVVADGKIIVRLDARGRCLAKKEALDGNRELVGVWKGQALVATGGELQAVALTPVEPKPAAAE
jgi:hypothetical protein